MKVVWSLEVLEKDPSFKHNLKTQLDTNRRVYSGFVFSKLARVLTIGALKRKAITIG